METYQQQTDKTKSAHYNSSNILILEDDIKWVRTEKLKYLIKVNVQSFIVEFFAKIRKNRSHS